MKEIQQFSNLQTLSESEIKFGGIGGGSLWESDWYGIIVMLGFFTGFFAIAWTCHVCGCWGVEPEDRALDREDRTIDREELGAPIIADQNFVAAWIARRNPSM